ncbi:MAG: glycosyl transferase group 1 [Caulobacteraceae bacterium]|nr:glycosyl transferase group 1 [Caulobacteraceae bacterium]
MRILNVGDFNWMTGAEKDTARLSLFDICRKFSLAATRGDHLVVEFSDRAVDRMGAPLRLKGLGRPWANRRFLQVVDELRPDLILLHFADGIDNASLAEARRLSPGVVIADINIDPIWTDKNRRRLALRRGVADALFVTTAEPALGEFTGHGAFAAFLPNPVDPAIETGRVFEMETPFDLLFPCGDDEPREIGGAPVPPSIAVLTLKGAAPGLRLSTPGVGGEPEARGVRYFQALQSARMGWALSRRAALPLYASDRMAHFFGWGLTVLLDRRAGFDRFYDGGEAIYYSGLDDLAAALRRLIADDASARAVARRGWEKTWRLFHSTRVLAYLLAQLFDDGGARDYEWPCERWAG